MVLVLITPGIMLFSAITYTQSKYPDEEIVLFSGTQNTFIDNLKKNGVFKDVYYCKPLYLRWYQVTYNHNAKDRQTYENNFIKYFDDIFEKSGYTLDDFKAILCVNDCWDGDFNLYLNYKKVHYYWLQTNQNNLMLQQERSSFNAWHNSIIDETKAISGLAEYAIPVLRSDSDKSIAEMNGKEYLIWDSAKDITKISDKKLSDILSSYNFSISDIYNSTLLILNSDGYAASRSWNNQCAESTKKLLGEYDYTRHDIYSRAYALAIDFFANENNSSFFVKQHPNDKIPPSFATYYGKKAKKFNEAPFEFILEFLKRNKQYFNTIIGVASASLENISNQVCQNKWLLGADFFRTFPFYCSLYGVTRFTKECDYQTVYTRPFINSQLTHLFKKLDYQAKLSNYVELSELSNVKGALIVVDASLQTIDSKQFNSISANNTVCFINAEFSEDEHLLPILEKCIPIEIVKEICEERVANGIHRNEYLWVYGRFQAIKEIIRAFSFEKILYSTGIRIFTRQLSLQEKYTTLQQMKIRFICDKFDSLEMKYDQLRTFIEGSVLTGSDSSLHQKLLHGITDMDSYLDMLSMLKEKYTIILAVKDTPGNNVPHAVIAKVRDLGFTNFVTKLWVMYAGFIENGDVLFNDAGKQAEDMVTISYFDSVTQNNYQISSQAWKQGNKAEIIINGVDYSTNIRGINLVVYDKFTRTVIDSIGYDAHDASKSHFIRKEIKEEKK